MTYYSILLGIILWIHLVAAVTWVGGIIFLTLIGPAIRAFDPNGSSRIRRIMARRFRNISWAAVGVLLISGMINFASWGPLTSLPKILSGNLVLQVKILLFALMIFVKALHDFFVGPKAALDSTQSDLWWRSAMFLGRVNLFLGLVVLYVATRLGRG